MNRSSSTFPPAVATNLREPAPGRTRALLCCGVLAGPIYIVVGLVQALTREGFDLTRHDLSLLANGRLGWIQITNLVVTGLMTIAAAVGIRRSWRGVRGGTWAPLLLGVYGAGLVAAGIFVADPTLGFPPGTPNGPGPVTGTGCCILSPAASGSSASSRRVSWSPATSVPIAARAGLPTPAYRSGVLRWFRRDRFRVGQPRHRARLLDCGHRRLGLAVGTLHSSLPPGRTLTWLVSQPADPGGPA